MPEETQETLEMIPFRWDDTKKLTLNAREVLGPLQSIQQDKVRERTEEFRNRVTEFVKQFHDDAPFGFFDRSVSPAYKNLNKYHLDLEAMENEGIEIGQPAAGAVRGGRHQLARPQDVPLRAHHAQACLGPRTACSRRLRQLPWHSVARRRLRGHG